MAPESLNATQLELHAAEITKPQPLRIIKRSKTISGCSAPGETLYRRSGSSFVSNDGEESPPLAADGPLTVIKLRNRRSTVLPQSNRDETNDLILNSTYPNEIQFEAQNDSDLTPKAKQENRPVSAGNFLKGEYFGGSLDFEAGRPATRADRSKTADTRSELGAEAHITTSMDNIHPQIPIRRVSKSKNFILRAIGGRSTRSPRPIRRSDSTTSKMTLIRRFSGSRKRSCDSSSCQSSFASSAGSLQLDEYEDANFQSIRVMSLTESSSLSSASQHLSSYQPSAVFVLCPQIIVTPESSSIDSSVCTIWVAVEVIGVLRQAEGQQAQDAKINSGSHKHGKLHSMHISLHPGQGCTILEVIGNLHQSKTIEEGETQLVLAKIRLGEVEPTTNAISIPSAKLIVDLQHHLGDTLSSYLTVRLTYKHSAFLNSKSPSPDLNGMEGHTSRIETEATATITRCNADSVWSRRNLKTTTLSSKGNAVVVIVEKHFAPEKARQIMKKLAANKIPSSANKISNYSITEYKNDQSISASKRLVGSIKSGISSTMLDCRDEIVPRRSVLPSSTIHLPSGRNAEHELDQIDPARKIWSEMRLTSGGRRHRNTRASISADHYFSFDSPEEEKGLKRSSPSFAEVLKSHKSNVLGIQGAMVDQERSRIMEVALRNQRSVGTETLRSIAPSVAKSVPKLKGGTIGGLGLRAWGWGTPWW